MRDYRAYVMGPDGHIKDRIEFWSKDDETAKKQAEQCVDGHDTELWHQDKKLQNLKTSSKTVMGQIALPPPPEPQQDSPRLE